MDSEFDAGNILAVDLSDPSNLRLRMQRDEGSDHMQWFYFRLTGAAGTACTLRIENAHEASYPEAWDGYQAVASYDQEHWFRVPTEYVDGQLKIHHEPTCDIVWYAYFTPYSQERHQRLIARGNAADGVTAQQLGRTLDGRSLDMLRIGEAGENKRNCWIIARQHPGESMAEWWMDGFIERLLDRDDARVAALLSQAVLYVVPNMNPDGSFRGHLRCNAVGANLNREWHEPSAERSPEVLATRNAMDRLGCDFCLDVHGDEELPYNFVSGAEGIPGFGPRQASLQKQFCDALEHVNPDFQQVHGYPVDSAGSANMSMCTNQIAARFDCLAMTLEQPFKDNADRPDPSAGWSPRRAHLLGRSAIDALADVVGDLR